MSRQRRKKNKPGKILLVLFISAGIAFLGLLSGGEHRQAKARRGGDPLAGYYPPEMPRYPEVNEMPSGPATRIGGTESRMSFFTTTDEPATIAGFYQRFWRSRRLYVRNDVTHMGGVVSAVGGGGRVYQAMIIASGKRSMVFPSMTRSPLAARQPSGDPPVPLFPKSRLLSSLASRDKGVRAQIVLSINDGGIDANETHYRRELAAAGYREDRSRRFGAGKQAAGEDAPQHRILLYSKPGASRSEITINLTSVGKDRVRVHIMAVGS